MHVAHVPASGTCAGQLTFEKLLCGIVVLTKGTAAERARCGGATSVT